MFKFRPQEAGKYTQFWQLSMEPPTAQPDSANTLLQLELCGQVCDYQFLLTDRLNLGVGCVSVKKGISRLSKILLMFSEETHGDWKISLTCSKPFRLNKSSVFYSGFHWSVLAGNCSVAV